MIVLANKNRIRKESIVNFLHFLSSASILTFFPLWAQKIGLNKPEIALLAIIYGITAFVISILSGRLSDRLGTRKTFIILGLLASSLSMLGMVVPNRTEFIFFRIISAIGFGMYLPALIALVSEKSNRIGNFFAYGALGWAIGIIIGGIIGYYWLPGIGIFSSISLFGAAIISITISEEKSTKKTQESIFSVFWSRKRTYLAFGIRQCFASAVFIYWAFFLIDLGANTISIAIIQCIKAIIETIIMYRWIDKLNSKNMIIYGLLLSSLGYFLFLIPTNFIGILIFMPIMSFAWAFLYSGTLRYSVEKSSFDKSTAAGLLTSIMAISGIIGNTIALLIILLGGTYRTILLITALIVLLVFFGFLFLEYLSLKKDKTNYHAY